MHQAYLYLIALCVRLAEHPPSFSVVWIALNLRLKRQYSFAQLRLREQLFAALERLLCVC